MNRLLQNEWTKIETEIFNPGTLYIYMHIIFRQQLRTS